jgi:hypothetical protein
MPSPITPLTNYPTLEEAANLIRTLVNDDGAGATNTVGEGQIIVDDATVSVKLRNALNSALLWLYQSMGNIGDPTLIADNYVVLNLPVIHGANGIGSPDPAAQVMLGYAGFFDGNQMWGNFKLPTTMVEPTRIWQRITSSNLPFKPVPQAQDGLSPNWQGNYLGEWEWREDGIWFNGALLNCDLRIRYLKKLSLFYGTNVDYSTTFIPLMGCVNAVANYAAKIIEASLNNPDAEAKREADANMHLGLLRNAKVRRAQGVNYHRPAYQEGQGTGLAMGFEW